MPRSPSGPRPVVAVRLHPANYGLLKSIAKEHNVPMASIVRWAIEHDLCRRLRQHPKIVMAEYRNDHGIPVKEHAA